MEAQYLHLHQQIRFILKPIRCRTEIENFYMNKSSKWGAATICYDWKSLTTLFYSLKTAVDYTSDLEQICVQKVRSISDLYTRNIQKYMEIQIWSDLYNMMIPTNGSQMWRADPQHMKTAPPKSGPKDPAIVSTQIKKFWKQDCAVGFRMCFSICQDLKM